MNKSSKNISKPSLDVQAINLNNNFIQSDKNNFGMMPTNSSSTPRKLISPKGLKSPL